MRESSSPGTSPATLTDTRSSWPHIYVSTGRDRRVSISVAGDLTGDELTRIAGSLRPIGD